MPPKPTVAIIDDEDMVRTSLQALFSIETDYQVLSFESSTHALEILSGTPVDLVISDYLMPELNGIDLLKRLRKFQPDVPCILLTGFADKQNAIRGINEVGLYQYLEKPWDNQQLLLVVRNALRQTRLRRQLADRMAAFDRLLGEHRELSRHQNHLEQELEMAARVQRELLPAGFPELSGFRFDSLYRPCRILGGDFYDAISDRTRCIMLLSDATGHGVRAALTCMLVKSIFRESSAGVRDPIELLIQMNARLHALLPEVMFVAAAVIWIDLDSAGVTLANAGLPFPYLLRSSGAVHQVPIAGFPLGLFPDSSREDFETKEVSLHPGDVLLLATDGLGDANNDNEHYFMDIELPESLRELAGQEGSRITEELIERAVRFSRDVPLADDVSMLAVTRR